MNGKRVWESLTTRTYTFALAAARNKESSLLLGESQPAKPSPAAPKSLEELLKAFLHDKRTSRKKDGSLRDPETIESYDQSITQFLTSTGVKSLRDVTRDVLRNWKDGLYDHPYAHWTVCNIYSQIATFLKFCGVDHKNLLREDERPTPINETPEAFSEEEMKKFFFAITGDREMLAFELFLKTGPREQELAHLEWSRLELGAKPSVSYKSRATFRTKTGKSRTVPLERGLADRLAEWRKKNPKSVLVFPTKRNKVEGHFLRTEKEIAERAGLRRETVWIHKFRDTFATWALRSGRDIRTVQHWLGHHDVSMTTRTCERALFSIQRHSILIQ